MPDAGSGTLSGMIPEGTATELLEMMDADHDRLRALLAGRDPAVLSHSANGKWSVIENLRHLLFNEQGLGRFTPGGVSFSPLGYPPPGLWKHKRFSAFRFDATPTADEVLAEWDSAHAVLRDSLTRDDAEVRLALGKYVRHLRNHIRQIESALRARP
ncbi:MAG: DinB family protein [Dehalococcoidia bacterium]